MRSNGVPSLGTLLFSGYIVYDTFLITKKLSPDESIIAAISLYLDFINLCKYYDVPGHDDLC